MNELYKKHKTIILYIFFGGLTTIVNIVTFTILSHVLMFKTTAPANLAAWFVSVIFAFVTNKYFVFEGGAKEKKGTIIELAGFFAARAFSGVADVLIVFCFVDILKFSKLPIKIASNVLVIILNYIASKMLIFKNK